MVADLIKDTKSDMSEFNPDMGEAGTIDLGSLGQASYEYDSKQGNYVVNISFKSTGDTAEYILGGNELSDLNDNGAKYYNDNLRVGVPGNNHWPFGSLDHLHWPNQTGK